MARAALRRTLSTVGRSTLAALLLASTTFATGCASEANDPARSSSEPRDEVSATEAVPERPRLDEGATRDVPPSAPTYATLDPSFGKGGHVVIDGVPDDVALEPSGALVFVASGHVGRLDAHGVADLAFAPALPSGATPRGIHRLPSGDFAVLSEGASAWYLTRVTAGGGLDATFGDGGTATIDAPAQVGGVGAIGPDGTIVVAALDEARGQLVVVRRDITGAVVATFGDAGEARAHAMKPRRLALTLDGRVVVLGDVGGTLFLLKLTTSGAADASFGTAGLVTLEDLAADGGDDDGALAVQPDGKIVVAASSGGEQMVARILESGRFDIPFGEDGLSYFGRTDVERSSSVAITADGEIVLAGVLAADASGERGLWLARLTSRGHPDASFGPRGVQALPSPVGGWGSVVRVAPDGKLVVGAAGSGDGPDAGGFYRLVP